MREIGSEFWSVPTTIIENEFFPNSTQWFLSGRSALLSIIKELSNCKTIGLPSWSCDSIIKPFIDAGFKVSFYSIYWDGWLKYKNCKDCDAVLIMDYFGFSGFSDFAGFFDGIIIRDLTHSLFSKSYDDADYYFGSLRKWCGFWTGGYAWSKDGHQLTVDSLSTDEYIELREKGMIFKELYINSSKSIRNRDKSYLELFSKAEELLNNVGAELAAERDVMLASLLDVDTIRLKRRSNARVLMLSFKDWLIFPELNDTDCPMFVPILVPNGKRNELRQFLIEHEIYCPVHWPISSYHRLDDSERYLYENELSLVCDQRYDENDMNRIVETINDFWKEVN